MLFPLYTAVESRSRETFLALMWALSYPGRIHRLPDPSTNYALIAETLLDLESSYYSTDDSLKSMLAHTGAKSLTADQAAYHFYPSLGERELSAIRRASPGTMLYPDEAATLIVGCELGSGIELVLHGPGVNGRQSVQINGVPDTFWQLRDSACRFPLGWDVYFVDGSQVVGLPRGVKIELR